jgi:hypothetical protein
VKKLDMTAQAEVWMIMISSPWKQQISRRLKKFDSPYCTYLLATGMHGVEGHSSTNG